MICPDCGEFFYIVNACDMGEPDCEPGWYCPNCCECIHEDEWLEESEGE